MLKELSDKNLSGMNAAYMKAVGVAPFRESITARHDAPSSVEQVLSNRLQDNVGLITSIAPTMLGQVQDVISEGVRGGLRVEDLSKQIQERLGVAESRANLIARDQTGKLNAQLTETRNRELGVTEYVWQVSGGPSGDGRVRDTHLELDGTTHRYDDPPITNDQGDRNNPGEDFQCRCSALPKLDDVLASLGI
jgi:SPP1 gp7 family putative phage head morphogenesis protein